MVAASSQSSLDLKKKNKKHQHQQGQELADIWIIFPDSDLPLPFVTVRLEEPLTDPDKQPEFHRWFRRESVMEGIRLSSVAGAPNKFV